MAKKQRYYSGSKAFANKSSRGRVISKRARDEAKRKKMVEAAKEKSKTARKTSTGSSKGGGKAATFDVAKKPAAAKPAAAKPVAKKPVAKKPEKGMSKDRKVAYGSPKPKPKPPKQIVGKRRVAAKPKVTGRATPPSAAAKNPRAKKRATSPYDPTTASGLRKGFVSAEQRKEALRASGVKDPSVTKPKRRVAKKPKTSTVAPTQKKATKKAAKKPAAKKATKKSNRALAAEYFKNKGRGLKRNPLEEATMKKASAAKKATKKPAAKKAAKKPAAKKATKKSNRSLAAEYFKNKGRSLTKRTGIGAKSRRK